jgi:LysR family cys regulon transcriptional activator
MNFQQLKSVREAVRRDFNLTEVAKSLYTSQPGVSRQIRELEEELGFVIFERAGKRLTGLTEPGVEILPIIERMLRDAENLKRASSEYTGSRSGKLVVATTHSQARYVLPKVVVEFKRQFPKVQLTLQQTFPEHIAELLLAGRADIGIATEALDRYSALIALPGYEWSHVVIVPKGHALTQLTRPLKLSDLVKHPLITYDAAFTGRSHIDEAFAMLGLKPEIVLTAMDADVIKTYVELGLGIGIVASTAIGAGGGPLEAISAPHLFSRNTTKVALRKSVYLRGYAYAFLELFAPHLKRGFVQDRIFAADAAAAGA